MELLGSNAEIPGWDGDERRQRRGGQAGRYPIGPERPTTISVYFRRTYSYRTYLGTIRGRAHSDSGAEHLVTIHFLVTLSEGSKRSLYMQKPSQS